MMRWHRSGQSCMSPSMVPSIIGTPLARLGRSRFACRQNTRMIAPIPTDEHLGHRGCILAAVLAATLLALPAAAQDFYAGKSLTFIVGSGVGGGYDLQARLAARHLGKHIPGHPAIVVQNMPAAGGIAATNHIFSTAPKDGTMIALIQRGMLLARLTNPGATRFEINK